MFLKLFIGKCKSSYENAINAVTGISFIHAQKERMTVIQEHIGYLNKSIESVKNTIDVLVKPYEMYINFLCNIPCFDRRSAISIISEIGTDMSQFYSHYHLPSLAGLNLVAMNPLVKRNLLKFLVLLFI